MTAVVTGGRTLADAAAELHIGLSTLNRWAHLWHGPLGSGNYRPAITDIDMMVARAWLHLPATEPWWGRVAAAAEHTIRQNPRRWLLIHQRRCHTFDTAEAAARWHLANSQPGVADRLIDLEAVS